MRNLTVFLLFLMFFFTSAYSQEERELQELYSEAEYFLLNEDYYDALEIYLQLNARIPDNANIAHKVGRCYLNIPGQKSLAIDYLESAVKNISARTVEGSITEKSSSYDALYDLAKSYRVNYMFDKAAETYRKYSETLLEDDKENRKYIEHEISVCENAKSLIDSPVNFSEQNLGEIFNDNNPNFNPVVSSDGKTFAFMVSYKFYDAVMISRNVNEKWTDPVNITPELQSDGDVYISALSADGKTIFLSKNDNFNSDIYYSNFNGQTWSIAEKLNKNINTRYWESQAYISHDGKYLIFSSDRPGGFGGLDLYISVKSRGDWGPAVNMGPEINTSFNEDRPVLINNGKSLYFSSQGHNSIGGYDFFRSDLQENELWSKPENLGYPVNTPDDNFFFFPVEDGKKAYYSAFKESKGFGKEDIYIMTFQK